MIGGFALRLVTGDSEAVREPAKPSCIDALPPYGFDHAAAQRGDSERFAVDETLCAVVGPDQQPVARRDLDLARARHGKICFATQRQAAVAPAGAKRDSAALDAGDLSGLTSRPAWHLAVERNDETGRIVVGPRLLRSRPRQRIMDRNSLPCVED